MNRARFNDGDQNTAVIDTDGSLAGFVLIDKYGQRSTKAFPISLNNLPFNAAYNSVDECLSEGGQNKVFEGRPTALMFPGSVGSLEFEALFPTTQPGPRHRPDPALQQGLARLRRHHVPAARRHGAARAGRAGNLGAEGDERIRLHREGGGRGDSRGKQAGIPKVITVTPGDVVMPYISSTNPFYVRLGMCYTSENKSQNNGYPTSPEQFVIERGYRSYGGGGIPTDRDKTLNLYWNKLSERYVNDQSQRRSLLRPEQRQQRAEPRPGRLPGPRRHVGPVRRVPVAVDPEEGPFGDDACIYPTSKLVKAECLDASQCQNALTKAGGVPDLGKYFYDAATGMLFFYVAQEFPNAVGPSPLGSCKSDGTGDASCPDIAMGETFYACPPQGCITYKVTLNDATYTPAPIDLRGLSEVRAAGADAPVRLAYKENNAPVVRTTTRRPGWQRRRVSALHARRRAKVPVSGAGATSRVAGSGDRGERTRRTSGRAPRWPSTLRKAVTKPPDRFEAKRRRQPLPACQLGRRLLPGRRALPGAVLPRGNPRERDQLHRRRSAWTAARSRSRAARRCVAARAELLRVGLERLIQIGELLLERLDGLLGAAHVLSLLEDASGAACRGGGAADGRGSHRLSAEEGPEQRGADRDRRLEPLLRDLLGFALHCLACAAESLLERGLLRRVFLAEPLEGVVALLAAGVLQARRGSPPRSRRASRRP